MRNIFSMVAFRDSNLNDFSYLFINKLPRYILSSFESAGLSVQEKECKIIFKMAVRVAIMDFRSKQF